MTSKTSQTEVNDFIMKLRRRYVGLPHLVMSDGTVLRVIEAERREIPAGLSIAGVRVVLRGLDAGSRCAHVLAGKWRGRWIAPGRLQCCCEACAPAPVARADKALTLSLLWPVGGPLDSLSPVQTA